MKAQMLKIAGVKSEKEFYKKFPDEASFMKAHGKEFKKAMRESKVKKAQFGEVSPSSIIDESTIDRPSPDTIDVMGQTARRNAERDAAILGRSTGGQNWDVTNPTVENLLDMRKAPKDPNIGSYLQAAGDVIGGLASIKQQKQDVAGAKQKSLLSGFQAKAVASVPMQPIQRKYVRPEDDVYQPDQMFRSFGVGTNPIAEDGIVINQIGGNPTEIMNTFAPNTIYSDMGYEPLSDSDKVKQFKKGGGLNSGGFADFMSGGGGDVLNFLGDYMTTTEGYQDAGTRIGRGVGQAVGTAIGGPVVGQALGLFTGGIGDILDPSDEKIAAYNRKSQQNMAEIMGSQAGVRFQNQFNAFMRSGGYVPKAQGGRNEKKKEDLTKKDGKCEREEKQKKVDAELSKASALADKAGEIAAKQEAKQIAATRRANYDKYVDERFDAYENRIKQKDFDAAYQAFAAQNPELAKDRMLYTVASKELPKLRSEAYSLRSKLNRIDPNLDYKNLTLPQLMQTMQKGFGGSEGYLRAWNEGFPERLYSIPQLTPIKQENGGQTSEYEWISHTWQPQVITHFGEHRMSDLLRPPHDADMLRAGGEIKQIRHNYVNPDEMMLGNMSMGGELRTHWGGYVEPMSYNRHMDGSGETGIIRGNSHETRDSKNRTGVGLSYGDTGNSPLQDYAEFGTEQATDKAQVEAQGGETVIEMNDSSNNQTSMNVLGALPISRFVAESVGDKSLAGMKYQNAGNKIVKNDKKINKKMSKLQDELADLEVNTIGDVLRLNTINASLTGLDMQQKENAEKLKSLAINQNAINETAEDFSKVIGKKISADALAKGKVKFEKNNSEMARNGKKLTKAQTGVLKPANSAPEQPQGIPYRRSEVQPTYAEYMRQALANAPELSEIPQPTETFQLTPYQGVSVVDFLAAQGKASSYGSRKQLAQSLGIENYKGTAKQNLDMLKKLQQDPSSLITYQDSGYGRVDVSKLPKKSKSTKQSPTPATSLSWEDFVKSSGLSYAPTSGKQEYIGASSADPNSFAERTSQYDDTYYLEQIANDPGTPRNIKARKEKEFTKFWLEAAAAALLGRIPLSTKILPYGLPAISEVSSAAQKALPAGKKLLEYGKKPVNWVTKSGMSFEDGGELEIAQAGKKIKRSELSTYINEGYKQDPKNPNRYVKAGKPAVVIPGTPGQAPSVRGAIRGGTPGKAWENQIKKWLSEGVTIDELVSKGHGTKAGLKKYESFYKPAVAATPDVTVPEVPEQEVFVEDVVGPTQETKTTQKTVPFKPQTQNLPPQLFDLLSRFRGRMVDPLDPRQLTGEFYALSQNELEPVPAQKATPYLKTPYDISFQQELNRNQSTFNALARQVGGNPSALASLAAQKYDADAQTLNKQFLANQQMRGQVYGENLDELKRIQAVNLGLMDRQYERQATAKSKTKAITEAALSSISDKVMQKQREDRELAVYENLFPNFRYDPNFRANVQGLAQFQIPTISSNVPIYDEDGNIIGYQTQGSQTKKTSDTTAKYGKKLGKNSSLVKAMKNL